MNLLQKQITEMQDQLNALTASSENKIAIEEYAVIIDTLNPVGEQAKIQYKDRVVLGNLPGDSALIMLTDNETDHLYAAQSIINEFIGLWNELDYKVRQGDILLETKQAVEKLNNDLQETNRKAWSEWLNELAARFETADAALDSQKDIPGLQQIVHEYRTNQRIFNDLKLQIPSDKSVINEILSLTESLENLLKKMDFDLPKAVKIFFERINNPEYGYQFPLELLTVEVIEWLKSNNELRSYMVKRKGMRQ